MTEWLIGKYVKDHEKTADPAVRMRYSVLASVTGIICNLFLFIVKIAAGLLVHSLAVVSDSFNNLSDAFSSLAMFFSNKLAARPADREHPFGHGRVEYLISFFMSAVIMFTGLELMNQGVRSVLHPQEVHFSLPVFAGLCLTIPVKIWLSRFGRIIGTRTDNMTILASSQDAGNDVLVTTVTLSAMVLSALAGKIPFDGIGCVLVAVLIIISGFRLASDIISRILGGPADDGSLKQIEEILCGDSRILGIHDCIIHEYGPGMRIGSAHAEMSDKLSLNEAHMIIDRAEKEIYDRLHIIITIHIDPVDVDDTQTMDWKRRISEIAAGIDQGLSLHDLHYQDDLLTFDILVPFGCRYTPQEIEKMIREHVPENIRLKITFDLGYMQETIDE